MEKRDQTRDTPKGVNPHEVIIKTINTLAPKTIGPARRGELLIFAQESAARILSLGADKARVAMDLAEDKRLNERGKLK